MKAYIFANSLVLFASYLVGAFVAWDIDAGNWDAAGRGMLMIVAIAACLLVSTAILDGSK